MMNRLQSTVLLTLLLSLDLAAQAQQPGPRKPTEKANSYGFVSPNTRENLKLEEAVRNLNSAAERRLASETRNLACRVGTRARIKRSLGNWADGAEHSLVFNLYSDEPTVRYALADLGRTWRQKTVLYFRVQAQGSAHMYVIAIRRPHLNLLAVARVLARALDESGVAYRTLVPGQRRVLIYVVDLSNELQEKVKTAARRLHARSSSFSGAGAFIGDDSDRDRAQEVFAKEIQSYEAGHSLNQHCRKIAPHLTGAASCPTNFSLSMTIQTTVQNKCWRPTTN